MKVLMSVILLLLSLSTVTLADDTSEPAPLSDAEIEFINNAKGGTWKAGRNFHESDLDGAQKLLGVHIDADEDRHNQYTTDAGDYDEDFINDLPTNFDARERWPHCESIREIRDQGDCGSCWALSTAEVMSDRYCIHKNMHIYLSGDDILTCCNDCGTGCNGGFPSAAWHFLHLYGTVTGGSYGSNQGCKPYILPPCNHHVQGPYKNCTLPLALTPRCINHCIAGYPTDYQGDKHFAQGLYKFPKVSHIMGEIYTNGPVTAIFTVYSDFFSYKSGVYNHTTGALFGKHAVKLLGWGVEDGNDYWLAANSWNVQWGDKGFFKILRGSNACGIEENVLGALPQL